MAEVLECANEQIPRRHALATSHWQRYITDQNTVAKYRPCSSTFSGIVHLHMQYYDMSVERSFAIHYCLSAICRQAFLV